MKPAQQLIRELPLPGSSQNKNFRLAAGGAAELQFESLRFSPGNFRGRNSISDKFGRTAVR
jgi:hypothetical protein